MAGKWRIEQSGTGLSRNGLNQLNKIFDSIEASISPAAPASVPSAAVPTPKNPGLVNAIQAEVVAPTSSVNTKSGTVSVAAHVSPSPGGVQQAVPLFTVIDEPFAASPYAIAFPSGGGNILLEASAGSAANFIANLPPATGSGYLIIVKKEDANAFAIAITPNGSDTIDGVNAAVNITTQFDTLQLIDDGSGTWATI